MFVKGDPRINRTGIRTNRFTQESLIKAIQKVEKEDKVDFLASVVRKALKNPVVMIAVLKKLIPDVQQTYSNGLETLGLLQEELTIGGGNGGLKIHERFVN